MQYAEIDSAVEAAKDPAVKEKESATRARRLIDPKLLEKAKTYTPEIEPEGRLICVKKILAREVT